MVARRQTAHLAQIAGRAPLDMPRAGALPVPFKPLAGRPLVVSMGKIQAMPAVVVGRCRALDPTHARLVVIIANAAMALMGARIS